MVKPHDLLDNTKCYEQIRQHCWPDGVSCPHCMSQGVTRQGKDDTQPDRQCY
ncbi:transposase [Microbulbifer sp. 2304DJ12-6]|uniref:transposase n=1 Tax=Microbulbifer sp. 2304DJ12-6 TaxID=3233340 RepID=UPI0039B0F8BD